MITVINGVTSKQVLADELISILNTMNLDGYFYLGYPVLGGWMAKSGSMHYWYAGSVDWLSLI